MNRSLVVVVLVVIYISIQHNSPESEANRIFLQHHNNNLVCCHGQDVPDFQPKRNVKAGGQMVSLSSYGSSFFLQVLSGFTSFFLCTCWCPFFSSLAFSPVSTAGWAQRASTKGEKRELNLSRRGLKNPNTRWLTQPTDDGCEEKSHTKPVRQPLRGQCRSEFPTLQDEPIATDSSSSSSTHTARERERGGGFMI